MAVTLAMIPRKVEVPDYLRRGVMPEQYRELAAFAHDGGISLFDGFAAFAAAMPAGSDPIVFATAHWLVIDGHWNQAGSDLFADAIAAYLAKSELATGR